MLNPTQRLTMSPSVEPHEIYIRYLLNHHSTSIKPPWNHHGTIIHCCVQLDGHFDQIPDIPWTTLIMQNVIQSSSNQRKSIKSSLNHHELYASFPTTIFPTSLHLLHVGGIECLALGGHLREKPGSLCGSSSPVPLVNVHPPRFHSNWKWPFIVSFPIKHGDFPLLC